MANPRNEIPLLIFAKAPQAGKVKTRLIPNCTAEQAARIAKLLLRASLQLATTAWPGRVILSTWPDINNSFMQELAEQFKVELALQGSGDLGEKMADGLAQHGYPAAIMGSDASLVNPSSLIKAHAILQDGENVIGPSEDGGYYLIGLSEPRPELFKDMPWGTDQVLALSLARQTHGNQLQLLEESFDIDTWEDVQRARKRLVELDRLLD